MTMAAVGGEKYRKADDTVAQLDKGVEGVLRAHC